MTQQQLLQEFRSFSTKEQIALMDKFQYIIKEKVRDDNSEQTRREKRLAAFKRLDGVLATDKPPTDDEIKEDYVNYITEKYS
ncbi:MAG: hypothetical protein H7Z37_16290 [Pyrinomonadaceae bacterium]|nr:hypothetical protein [Pyrinomonadaceae bacterium]